MVQTVRAFLYSGIWKLVVIHAFFRMLGSENNKSQQLGDFSCGEGLRRPGENGMKRASQPVTSVMVWTTGCSAAW
mgnify:CR=1 FL=1